MPTRYHISDLHLGHKLMARLRKRRDGTSFNSTEEHDDYLIACINEVVNPTDTLCVQGDISFGNTLHKLNEINGSKVLIMGNHDEKSYKKYGEYFAKIHGAKKDRKKNVVFTHYPVHPSCLHGGLVNVHGHTHSRDITEPGYVNVSVEALDYAPISADELLLLVEKERILLADSKELV